MIPTKLQRYVLREVIRVGFISAAALTAVIFVGLSLELIRDGLSIVQLYDVIPYALAMSLPFALPCALLLATVFVFGRLSGQNELTAMRCSGLNVNYVIWPVLALGLLVCAGTFALNHYLLPWSHVRVRLMRDRIIGRIVLKAGSTMKAYRMGDKHLVYIGGTDELNREWKNVAVIKFADEYPAEIMVAARGYCAVKEDLSVATLNLFQGNVVRPRLGQEEEQPGAAFHHLRLNIPLGEDKDISSFDRPKYLTLPRLRLALETLRAEARRLIVRPEYADAQHPKTRRKRFGQELHKAQSEAVRLGADVTLRTRRMENAQADLDAAERDYQIVKGAYDAAVRRAAEMRRSVEEMRPYLEQLRKETADLLAREVDEERLALQERETAAAEERLAELRKRLDEASAELTRQTAAHTEAEKRRKDAQTALASARAEADALKAEWSVADARHREKAAFSNGLRTLEKTLNAETDYHFRNAGAMTAFVFMLVGIPLGVVSRRGHVIMAFVISFCAVLAVYYPLVIVGQMLAQDGYMAPWLSQWLPNLVVGGLGLVLLRWGIRR